MPALFMDSPQAGGKLETPHVKRLTEAAPSALRGNGKTAQVTVGDTQVEVSNLGKIFYPSAGFTKGDVVNFYIRIAPVLLPHLKDRPITLKRYPEGVDGLFFYEKRCPPHRPHWIKTTNVPRREGGQINYCVVDTLPALVWAANLADLELHTFLHRMPHVDRPTALAFDLDPGAPANILSCCEVALRLKELFDRLRLECFAKTSGSKGLQVYVPLNVPVTYDTTKAFALAVAESLQRQTPEAVVSKMSKALRRGKVFVDWSQNDTHKTTVNVYSLRAKERPWVSTPITWKEVQAALKRNDPQALEFEAPAVLERVGKSGDLFAPVLKLRQKLPPPERIEAD
ncbi:MAG TPA: non-homologous end-joining DNA ligase [Candidatus Acidoferrum sp.]|nr:non-homologous end-joining DNA ligase [Candidatus Acidoferrum sp.]